MYFVTELIKWCSVRFVKLKWPVTEAQLLCRKFVSVLQSVQSTILFGLCYFCLFVFQNMMIVSDPSIAGKAGDLSERRCTVTRSQSRDIVEAKEEEVGLVPDPDLRMTMVMSQ